MSGYCAIGSVESAGAPAIVVTIAMTMARRGRSTKIADSMASALIEGALNRCRPYRRTRAHALEPLHDPPLAAREAGIDHDAGAGFATGLDAFDDRLAVLDDENVDAFLIGNQRSLRNHDFFFGGTGLGGDPHQLPVDERAGGIRESGGHRHRVGGPIDAHAEGL